MAEELLGPVFEIHGMGSTSSSRITEQLRAVECPRPRVRPDLDPQRHPPFHRREDVQVAGQRRDHGRGARPAGTRDPSVDVPRRALAEADGLLRGDASAGCRPGRRLPRGLRVEPAPEGLGPVHGCARRRLQHARRSRDHARMAQPRSGTPCARAFGLGALAETWRHRRRWSVSPVADSRRARTATSARRIALKARSSPRAGS